MKFKRSLYPSGFTLLEVITTLLILGIVCCYGLSFLPSLLNKNQMEVVADEIKQAIHIAKIEALINARTVILKPLTEEGDWSSGMALCVEDPSHHVKNDTMLLREWHWRKGVIRVTWQGFESKQWLRVSPSLAERAVNGQFIVRDNARRQIKLIINRLGRVRQE